MNTIGKLIAQPIPMLVLTPVYLGMVHIGGFWMLCTQFIGIVPFLLGCALLFYTLAMSLIQLFVQCTNRPGNWLSNEAAFALLVAFSVWAMAGVWVYLLLFKFNLL